MISRHGRMDCLNQPRFKIRGHGADVGGEHVQFRSFFGNEAQTEVGLGHAGFGEHAPHDVFSGGNGCIGALSNVVPEICAAWVRAFRENDLAGIARGQQTIDRLMDLYAIRSPFLPVIKEACRLRGIAATSAGTFPMPSATVEDDARILELLNREGVQ